MTWSASRAEGHGDQRRNTTAESDYQHCHRELQQQRQQNAAFTERCCWIQAAPQALTDLHDGEEPELCCQQRPHARNLEAGASPSEHSGDQDDEQHEQERSRRERQDMPVTGVVVTDCRRRVIRRDQMVPALEVMADVHSVGRSDRRRIHVELQHTGELVAAAVRREHAEHAEPEGGDHAGQPLESWSHLSERTPAHVVGLPAGAVVSTWSRSC